MTRPGIEPRSPKPLENNLTIIPMSSLCIVSFIFFLIYIYIHLFIYLLLCLFYSGYILERCHSNVNGAKLSFGKKETYVGTKSRTLTSNHLHVTCVNAHSTESTTATRICDVTISWIKASQHLIRKATYLITKWRILVWLGFFV